MSKELEALKRIETTFELNKEGKESVYKEYTNSIYPYYEDFDLVLNALNELKQIKEAKPSEALENLRLCWAGNQSMGYYISSTEYEHIEQALQRLDKYEQILGSGRLTDKNYKNTTLDLDSCKPYLRLGQLEDIYEGTKK